MIRLTRLNGTSYILNCELIETIEETPDTVISTVNGKKFVVMETIEEIIEEVLKYKQKALLINKI
ncbi:MAG: flagellar FlbD family protein [Acetivibrionales bacterium]|jgi:flagellar protein FlbD